MNALAWTRLVLSIAGAVVTFITDQVAWPLPLDRDHRRAALTIDGQNQLIHPPITREAASTPA